MKPQSAKAKGRKFQQWVRDKLIEASEGLTKDDVRSTSMGAGGNDILLSTAGKAVYPWAIECKAQERVNIWEAYAQAEANSEDGDEPVVFLTRNRQKPLALVDAEWLIKQTARSKNEEVY